MTGYRFDRWQRSAGSFDSLALFGSAGFTADRGVGAIPVSGVRVSTNYFGTLGISPLLGRSFTAADGEPGAAPVVMLSHGLWQQWFGGREDALGQQVRLSGRLYTVVGVMPPVVFPAWPVNPADVTLDADSRQLWVPIGFAHGYVTLEADTEVLYKTTGYYSPQHERSLAWDDPALAIDWRVPRSDVTLSEKDRTQPRLADLGVVFPG